MTIENKLNQIEQAIKEIRAELKPEKSYAERQAEWLKETGVKVGSRVRVTRAALSHEYGWGTHVVPEMNNVQESRVEGIDEVIGLLLEDGWWFPYFVLEPVKEKVKKYRVAFMSDGTLIDTRHWRGHSYFANREDFEKYATGARQEFIGLIKSTEKEFEE